MRHVIFVIAVTALVTHPAHAQSTKSGMIASFECGDNCYLTIIDNERMEFSALCAAAECAPWNGAARWRLEAANVSHMLRLLITDLRSPPPR